jgi:hypothetical protein
MEKTQSNKGIHYLLHRTPFSLHFANAGISSRFLRPWFLTPPTKKLKFPPCFFPKLPFLPPPHLLFLTYEGAQTFSVIRFFLPKFTKEGSKCYCLCLSLSLSLSLKHSYVYPSADPDILSFRTRVLQNTPTGQIWLTFSRHKYDGQSRKVYKFHVTTHFSSPPRWAIRNQHTTEFDISHSHFCVQRPILGRCYLFTVVFLYLSVYSNYLFSAEIK